MKELFQGVREFSSAEFEKNRELFHSLKNQQSPHTLFVGCSDSRVVPSLITKTLPGELFIIRNIANIVPYYRISGEFLATTSAIEYAVKILNIQNIVICGHSNCGGCRALFDSGDKLQGIPHTGKWLELARPALDKVLSRTGNHTPESIHWLVEQENIVLQMNHLITYPYIKEKYKKREIQILGWYYDIGEGEIYNYNLFKRQFERIE